MTLHISSLCPPELVHNVSYQTSFCQPSWSWVCWQLYGAILCSVYDQHCRCHVISGENSSLLQHVWGFLYFQELCRCSAVELATQESAPSLKSVLLHVWVCLCRSNITFQAMENGNNLKFQIRWKCIFVFRSSPRMAAASRRLYQQGF